MQLPSLSVKIRFIATFPDEILKLEFKKDHLDSHMVKREEWDDYLNKFLPGFSVYQDQIQGIYKLPILESVVIEDVSGNGKDFKCFVFASEQKAVRVSEHFENGIRQKFKRLRSGLRKNPIIQPVEMEIPPCRQKFEKVTLYSQIKETWLRGMISFLLLPFLAFIIDVGADGKVDAEKGEIASFFFGSLSLIGYLLSRIFQHKSRKFVLTINK